MSTGHPLGIDVGGSGIKGAPVDLELGEFAQKRRRIDTPEVSTPEAVCDVIAQVVDHFDEVRSDSPIGVTIPGVVQHGIVKTAANIDKSWIGCEIEKLLEDRLQHDVVVVNDADAAGVGELEFGAAKGHQGLVILTTLGTGIGTAIFNRGVLVPNSELGHLEIDGVDAETVAASSAKTPRTSATSSGRSACRSTTAGSRTSSGPTSSWSAAGCRRTPTSSSPSSTSVRRSSPRP